MFLGYIPTCVTAALKRCARTTLLNYFSKLFSKVIVLIYIPTSRILEYVNLESEALQWFLLIKQCGLPFIGGETFCLIYR